MPPAAPSLPIDSYHAHVYFDAETREQAKGVREEIERLFDVEMGRWHEKLVGPHPRWSYQIAFQPQIFAQIVPWLMLNRRGLTVFLHPNTGDDLADHRDAPVWMGEKLDLDLSIFNVRKTE